jgi:hypothetical protein
MPLYQEELIEKTIQEQRFTRSYMVTVANPLNGTPSIRYDEERISRKNGIDVRLGYVGNVTEFLTPANLDDTFDLILPGGEVVGEATYGQVQLFLYSLYFHLAAKRDEVS